MALSHICFLFINEIVSLPADIIQADSEDAIWKADEQRHDPYETFYCVYLDG